MRRLLLTSLALALLGLTALLGPAAAPASAHGELVDGSPGPGDDVAVGTTSVRIDFTALDPDQVPLVAVLGTDDEPVAVGEAELADDRTICAVSAPLEAGVHTLEYSVLSDDGDRQRSRYTFEVSDAGDPAEPGACDTLALSEPGEAQTLDEMASGTVPTAVLFGLGALAVLAAGLLVLRIRSDRRRYPADTPATDTPATDG